MIELKGLLQDHLSNWQSGWSMGTFGAIAEFHQDDGEAPVVDEPATLTRATQRGGIRLNRLADVIPVAYETLSPKRHRWSQAVALCLPQEAARRPGRSALTELGPDAEAIRDTDRDAVLFDMGLSLPQCDFCIRTADPELLAALRANVGRSLFDHDNTAMPAILSAHPHRVALTNIGRVEVYQKIGGPDTGGVSPPGPHTHLLPKLLRSGRTHSANTPIPDGLSPLGSLHPGNPVIGPMGEERPFDQALQDDFQNLLRHYGVNGAFELKQRARRAIDGGQMATQFDLPDDRFARASLRLALRQIEHEARARRDVATLERLQGWLLVHEGADEMAEDDAPGH